MLTIWSTSKGLISTSLVTLCQVQLPVTSGTSDHVKNSGCLSRWPHFTQLLSSLHRESWCGDDVAPLLAGASLSSFHYLECKFCKVRSNVAMIILFKSSHDTRVLPVQWNPRVGCLHTVPLNCWDLHCEDDLISSRLKPHGTDCSRYMLLSLQSSQNVA